MEKNYPSQDEGFDVSNGSLGVAKKKRSISVYAILAILAVVATIIILVAVK